MGSGVDDAAEVLSHLQSQSHPPKKWRTQPDIQQGEGVSWTTPESSERPSSLPQVRSIRTLLFLEAFARLHFIVCIIIYLWVCLFCYMNLRNNNYNQS